ncbi:F0F1 ATP synthase subunit alpha [Candidatus Daviesbacteria bacterium]|nr:F0F1 ATP synthase subunit alpha [Candidatus Daviesbacteria bacterium]
MNNGQEVGFAVSVRDFLVHVDGLPTVRINDMVEADNGARGWVNSLSETSIEVLMLDEAKIEPGQTFKRLPNRLGIPVGEFLLTRSINPLGLPIDGKGPLTNSKNVQILELERSAPGIESREYIHEQFLTGITVIDTIIPIGLGQRELIMGDAHSGKTQFLIDIIINQKGTGVVCIYASIGKPAVSVRNLIDVLAANGALYYTIVIATSSSEPAPLIFLTPKTAFSVAEYFQKKGHDVLLILDDLGAHAKIYREIALLGNKAPGRESYPGDIFYQHAHLLERAGNFLKAFGGGSITALPAIELNLNDFTTFIPTNLMSMTDGHLLFKASMRSQGQTPAIDISLSVSRVGRQTQEQVSNLLSTRVRQVLSAAADLETIARFSSELSPETQLILKRRDLILEVLKQEPFTPIPKGIQVALLALPFTTFFQDKSKEFMEKYKKVLVKAFLEEPQLIEIAKTYSKVDTDDELIKMLEGVKPVLAKLCP